MCSYWGRRFDQNKTLFLIVGAILLPLFLAGCDTQYLDSLSKPEKITQSSFGSGSCRLPWGGFLENGDSIEAFSIDSVPCDQSCSSFKEVRTCVDGELSGSDQFNISFCGEVGCPGCELNTSDAEGITLKHGEEISLYDIGTDNLSCSDTCENHEVTAVCDRGEVIGVADTTAYQSTCSFEPCGCELPYPEDGPEEACGDSTFCAHGTTLQFFKAQEITCANCNDSDQSIERTCDYGVWRNNDVPMEEQQQFVFRTCSHGDGDGTDNCLDCEHPDPSISSPILHNSVAPLYAERFPVCEGGYDPNLCNSLRANRLCYNGELQSDDGDGGSLESYIYQNCQIVIPDGGCGPAGLMAPPPPPPGEENDEAQEQNNQSSSSDSSFIAFFRGFFDEDESDEDDDGDDGNFQMMRDGFACGTPADENIVCNLPWGGTLNGDERIIRYTSDTYACGQSPLDVTIEITCSPDFGVQAFFVGDECAPLNLADYDTWLDIPQGPTGEVCECTTPWGLTIEECAADADPATCDGVTSYTQSTARACIDESCSDFEARFICQYDADADEPIFIPDPNLNPDAVWLEHQEGTCQPSADCSCFYQGTAYAANDPESPLQLYKENQGTCATTCDEAHLEEFFCQIQDDELVFVSPTLGLLTPIIEAEYQYGSCAPSTNCVCDLPDGFADIDYLNADSLDFDAFTTATSDCVSTCDDKKSVFTCALDGEDAVQVIANADENPDAEWNEGTGWLPECSESSLCSCTAWEDHPVYDPIVRSYNADTGQGGTFLAYPQTEGTCANKCDDIRENFRCLLNDDGTGAEFRSDSDNDIFNDDLFHPQCGGEPDCECSPFDGVTFDMGPFPVYQAGTVSNCFGTCPMETLYCVVDADDENAVVISDIPNIDNNYNWNGGSWQPTCPSEGCQCVAWGGTDLEVVKAPGETIEATPNLDGTCAETCGDQKVTFTCEIVGDPADEVVAFKHPVTLEATELIQPNWNPYALCENSDTCQCDPYNGDPAFIRSVGQDFDVYESGVGTCFSSCSEQENTFWCVLDPNDGTNNTVTISDNQTYNPIFEWVPENWSKTCTNGECACETPWGMVPVGNFEATPSNAGTCDLPCSTNTQTFSCVIEGDETIVQGDGWNNGIGWQAANSCNQSNACSCETDTDWGPVNIGTFDAASASTPNCGGGEACAQLTKYFECRYTQDGTEIVGISGSDWNPLEFPYERCSPNPNCSCSLPWGATWEVGDSGFAFNTPQVDCGLSCQAPDFAAPIQCQADGPSAILMNTLTGEELVPGDFPISSCFPKNDCAGDGGGEHGGDGDGQGLGSYGDDAGGGPGGGGPGGPGGGCAPIDGIPQNVDSMSEAVFTNYSRNRCQLPAQFSVPHDGIPDIFNIGGTIAPGVRVSAFRMNKVCVGMGSCEEQRVSLFCDYDGELYSPSDAEPSLLYPSCEIIDENHPDYGGLCP